MDTCANCKHWDRWIVRRKEGERWVDDPQPVGACGRWTIADLFGRRVVAKSHPTAELLSTPEEFGCNLHEPAGD